MENMRDGPKYRLNLENRIVLLNKRKFDLLKHIEECGSIMKASKQVKIPYRSALKYIEDLENDVNHTIVSTKRGGKGDRGGRGDGKKKFFRKKVCFFCSKKIKEIDYKNVELMRRFITEHGKILPRRITGTCAKHQRLVSTEIRRARVVALLPFTDR